MKNQNYWQNETFLPVKANRVGFSMKGVEPLQTSKYTLYEFGWLAVLAHMARAILNHCFSVHIADS
jgi:hypothetical protein